MGVKTCLQGKVMARGAGSDCELISVVVRADGGTIPG